MYRKVTILFVFLAIHCGLEAQCTLDTSIVMEEIDTSKVIFEVEGATVNDLSNPIQGLCKVRIFFEHEFLGDLRIFLISPAGQRVQLVGNEGNFGLTQFTEWNVCFVPLATMANPDIGFLDRWSNNQLWGAFSGIYSGSYYPFQGNLEDFDTGPVNGVWSLIIMDRTQFYRGKIKEVELEFCNNDGLICNACNPGSLSLQLDDVEYCVRDSINLDVLVDFKPNTMDSLEYNYQLYIIGNDGMVRDSGKTIELINYPSGEYSLCGLIYYVGDSLMIPKPNSNWNQFKSGIKESPVCLTIGDCIDFTIFPDGDTIINEVVLCGQDSLIIDGVDYDSTGEYFIHLLSHHECDSIVHLKLTKVQWKIDLLVRDTLDCNLDSTWVILDSVSFSNSISFKWLTANNVLLDSTSRDSIIVRISGQVKLIVEDLGCEDTIVINVPQDSSIPTVMLLSDTLSCLIDSVEILSQTNASFPLYKWSNSTGPLPQTGSIIKVGQAGTYFLEVTADNGCSALSSIQVLSDTIPADITLDYDSLVCQEDSIIIGLFSNDSLTNVKWGGPNGFTSNESDIIVFDTGLYVVSAIGENGCSIRDSINVTKYLFPDSVSLLSQPIYCDAAGRISFRPIISDIVDFQWFGPRGFLSKDSLILTDVPGWYFFDFEGENSCRGMDSILLIDRRTYPNIVVRNDPIACLGDTAYIYATSDSLFSSIYWIKPSGDTIRQDSVFIDENGPYFIHLISQKGCSLSHTVVINASNSPILNLSSDTIYCRNNKMAEVRVTSNRSNIIYNWSLDGNQVSQDSAFLVDEGGLYILRTISPEGCKLVDSVVVLVDTIPPRIILSSPDTITCSKKEAEIITFTNPQLVQFQWSGPNGFIFQGKNPIVTSSGVYNVVVTSINSCTVSASIFIAIDTVPPDFNLLNDTITCSNRMATINSDSTSDQWNWNWLLPDSSRFSGLPLMSSLAGLHKGVVTNIMNGCTTQVDLNIEIDTIGPTFRLSDTIIDCGINSIFLNPNWPTEVEDVTWKDPNGRLINDRSINASLNGNYIVTVRDKGGCESMDTFYIEKRDLFPHVNLMADTINCLRSSARVWYENANNLQSFSWLDSRNIPLFDDTIVVFSSDIFRFFAESSQGCKDTFEIEIELDTIPPNFQLIKDGDLICEKESVRLSMDLSPSTNMDIFWFFKGDTIQQNEIEHHVRNTGTYRVEVRNNSNGCSYKDSIVVADTGVVELSYQIDIIPPSCEGRSNGVINVINIEGGLSPYNIIFNGIEYEAPNIFDFLRLGTYPIKITDSNGCEVDTTIILNDKLGLEIDAGRDTSIRIGKSVTLQGQIVNRTGQLEFSEWIADSMVFGLNQLNPEVSPIKTTIYSFRVTLPDGCVAIDEVTVYVDDRPSVYVPNIFTPNGDGVNDNLVLGFGPGVKLIKLIQIFNRWGEMVFSSYNLDAQTQNISWDGTLDNQALNPSVFTYRMIVVSDSLLEYKMNGTITLLR